MLNASNAFSALDKSAASGTSNAPETPKTWKCSDYGQAKQNRLSLQQPPPKGLQDFGDYERRGLVSVSVASPPAKSGSRCFGRFSRQPSAASGLHHQRAAPPPQVARSKGLVSEVPRQKTLLWLRMLDNAMRGGINRPNTMLF